MRPYGGSRAKVNATALYARKTAGRDRMIHEKCRPAGKTTEGRGKQPRLADVWPEK